LYTWSFLIGKLENNEGSLTMLENSNFKCFSLTGKNRSERLENVSSIIYHHFSKYMYIFTRKEEKTGELSGTSSGSASTLLHCFSSSCIHGHEEKALDGVSYRVLL